MRMLRMVVCVCACVLIALRHTGIMAQKRDLHGDRAAGARTRLYKILHFTAPVFICIVGQSFDPNQMRKSRACVRACAYLPDATRLVNLSADH